MLRDVVSRIKTEIEMERKSRYLIYFININLLEKLKKNKF